MFSFVGDTVLDPFMGTGTTNLAAAMWGRNSVGTEIDPHYFSLAEKRMHSETGGLFKVAQIESHRDAPALLTDPKTITPRYAQA